MVEKVFKEKCNGQACENIDLTREVAIGLGMVFD